MRKTRALSAFAVLAIFSVALGACGDSDDSSTSSSVATSTQAAAPATPAATTKAGGGEGKARGAEGSTSPEDAKGSRGAPAAKAQKPASLSTDPGSIKGATVTATGAVQTLPPSSAAQAEAMENSYSSIKGFGEESEGSEATDITFALVQYLTAKAAGDWATACARIYTPLRESVAKSSGGDCPVSYGELMKRGSKSDDAEAAKIDVASVRRGEGARAFVIYKTPDTLSADMPMYLDGGVWTVGALEAYVLTPEQLEENQ